MKKEVGFPAALTTRTATPRLWFMVVALIACMALPAFAGSFVPHNTPNYVKTAKNLGPEDPSKTMEVSIWLKPHNRSQLDAMARQVYDRNSPSYRHFLNRAEIAKMIAPTAAEAATVQKFLESQNLKVVRVGPDNFFVRAQGAVRDVETAFHVQLNNYQVRDKVVRANASDPYVEGDAAELVFSVSGLDSGKYEHPLMTRPSAPKTTGTRASVTASSGNIFSSVCFNGPVTDVLSNNNDGSYPIGTYTGKHLNLQTVTSNGCGYTPPAIQTAYNLSGLYAEGFDGTGQTVGIIDWCGSLTITADANAFSKRFGLPALTSSNFQIIYTPTQSTC